MVPLEEFAPASVAELGCSRSGSDDVREEHSRENGVRVEGGVDECDDDEVSPLGNKGLGAASSAVGRAQRGLDRQKG
jgi:hypothetical protein